MRGGYSSLPTFRRVRKPAGISISGKTARSRRDLPATRGFSIFTVMPADLACNWRWPERRLLSALTARSPALDLAAENARLNGLEERCEWRLSNVYEALESIGASGEKFGLVIADPPAFVKSKSAFRAGLRGYRKLARLAAAAIAPAGYLMICSCSHHVGRR